TYPILLLFLSTPPPTPEIYTLSLHDALPIWINGDEVPDREVGDHRTHLDHLATELVAGNDRVAGRRELAAEDMNIRAADAAGFQDRKSTRLNSSHVKISYAVFCLKKKKKKKK